MPRCPRDYQCQLHPTSTDPSLDGTSLAAPTLVSRRVVSVAPGRTGSPSTLYDPPTPGVSLPCTSPGRTQVPSEVGWRRPPVLSHTCPRVLPAVLPEATTETETRRPLGCPPLVPSPTSGDVPHYTKFPQTLPRTPFLDSSQIPGSSVSGLGVPGVELKDPLDKGLLCGSTGLVRRVQSFLRSATLFPEDAVCPSLTGTSPCPDPSPRSPARHWHVSRFPCPPVCHGRGRSFFLHTRTSSPLNRAATGSRLRRRIWGAWIVCEVGETLQQ